MLHLPRLLLSYEQLLREPTTVVQRCRQLVGIPTTTPGADLLVAWIRPDLNYRRSNPDGLAAQGESQTLMDLA